MARRRRRALTSVATLGLACAAGAWLYGKPVSSVGRLDDHPAIQYTSRPTNDRVVKLNRNLVEGTRSLRHDHRTGYLLSVLDALGVPVESQLLVFSKTGIQRDYTGPNTPRALFFNASVIVGYVPGAPSLELAAHDPQQGVVFYTLEQAPAPTPTFTRRTTCLTCHVSSDTLEVPGTIARSHLVGDDGRMLANVTSHTVDHRTPHTDRWGGWFVTSTMLAPPPYAQLGHLGNITTSLDPSTGTSIVSNKVFIDWIDSAPETRGYLSGASDIATLLIFDHQMHAMNLLTRLNWESRVAASGGRLEVTEGPLRNRVNQLADYLLFVVEAPPTVALSPPSGFVASLRASVPRDRLGRSFGQLDLDKRLLRYPCSYMVYSEAFDGLSPAVKEAVYRRIFDILLGRDAQRRYANLSPADRAAIVEILRDTKPDLPADLRG